MLDRELLPEFSAKAQSDAARMTAPAKPRTKDVADLRSLLWCSIDNDDSRDLDQLTVAQPQKAGVVKVLIAIADVDALVPDSSAIDLHARHNTTSIYTAAQVFPMLPENLSTDLTSLNPGEDRLAVVAELMVDEKGVVTSTNHYPALVHNHAKLAYNALDDWLDGRTDPPAPLAAVKGLDENIRLQDRVAALMRKRRSENGALDLRTIAARAVIVDDEVVDLQEETRNQPKELIEDFMIAANVATAKFLAGKGWPSIRRIVKTPRRWDRIVSVAEENGEKLPPDPDSKALEEFLTKRRLADPLRFPDLSLTIVKLLGSGEYVVEVPGKAASGHFGLAIRDYTHSTAPNRRYPDLITQRMVKAALEGRPAPYSVDELEELAAHCTARENDAEKVERQVAKSAAALLLQSRVGDRFDAIVTGASEKGTWVRILRPPVEGKLMKGSEGLDVGDRLQVKLTGTNVERGFIDFVRVRNN